VTFWVSSIIRVNAGVPGADRDWDDQASIDYARPNNKEQKSSAPQLRAASLWAGPERDCRGDCVSRRDLMPAMGLAEDWPVDGGNTASLKFAPG